MNKSEILKKEILRQYKSVRQFAIEMNIPYSTLATALDNKIDGMAYGTVLRICDKLRLNPIDFNSLSKISKINNLLNENHVSYYFSKLNEAGKNRLYGVLEDLVAIDKYTDKSLD